ncbi:MAG: SGNH/GDSL hydrolase family protein [Deltaproteobacteria bacterium]|nr:SGNH/GDSL hydrolase family protein [Deltaproteobacteria bacterium]
MSLADPRLRRVFALLLLGGTAALWIASQRRGGVLLGRWSLDAFLACSIASWCALGASSILVATERVRERALGFLAATLVVVACLGLAEATALAGHNWSATFRLDPQTTLQQLTDRVNRRDPELIHVHWPNSTFSGEVPGNLAHFGPANLPGYHVEMRYDANGFRNDTTLARADVVAIGDSFVEGVLVAREHTVSEQVARRIGATVANLGQSAYGFRQELIVLERFGLPLRPRVVLWFLFGGNDFRDVEEFERMLERVDEAPPKPPFRQRSFVRSGLLALSRALGARRSASVLHTAHFRRASGERELVIFGHATQSPSEHQWRTGTETLLAAQGRAREIGARFLVVYIPRKFEVYQGLLEIPEGSLVARWKDARLNERVAAWAESQGIDFLDTTPVLRREVEAGSHPYLLDDVHWNERGHELAAELISRRLREGAATSR